jgi:arsenate reductase (thioredoxin)
MATVLFVCLHNAGRSQISAALFEQAAAGRHRALSAGTAHRRARGRAGRGGGN